MNPISFMHRMHGSAFVIVTLVLLALCTTGPVSADDGMPASMASQMEVNRLRYGIAGQAVYIAQGQRVIYRGVDGEANLQTAEAVTLDHVFPVYSLSKLFASTLVMQLVEAGEINLDSPAGAYLADLPPGWQGVSVRHFLNHTSGVPEYLNRSQYRNSTGKMVYPSTTEELFASLTDEPLLFAPGSESRYTQTNFLVLSELLSRHYGKPYPLIVQERILQPLGMKHTWLGTDALSGGPRVVSYIGEGGRLRKDPELILPSYAYAHGSLHLTLGDLASFLQALASGELVGEDTLARLWQEPLLASGRRGIFASGWDYGERGSTYYVGHDGGTKVRVRIVPGKTSNDPPYLAAYLTNGSARNVWSSVLVDSALAATAPEFFPVERLQEELIGYAAQPADEVDAHEQIRRIRASSNLDDKALESIINSTGYLLLQNLDVDTSIRVFILNTLMYPGSANAWHSLGEAYAAQGEAIKAEAAYAMSRRVAQRTKN